MSRTSDFDVVVVGSANTDFLIRGQKLPKPGETAQGEQFHEGAGGKGANQAVAAARLGARVAFVSRIGSDDRGAKILRGLTDEGIDVSQVTRDDQAPTGVALVMVEEGGQKQILTASGANGRLTPEHVQAAAPVIKSTKVLVAQLELPLESVVAAFRIARQADALVVFDPAPAVPLADDLLRLVDVIRPNAGEAEVITGIRVADRRSARRAADWFLARGIRLACVEAADEGNLLVWDGGEELLPRLPVKSIDATGAGDAFAAALAVQLAEGRSFVEAGKFANAAAALATTKVGAQEGLGSRAEVEKLLAEVG